MRHSVAVLTAAFLFAALPLGARHDDRSGPAFYKVEFTVHDGSIFAHQGDSHYTMMVDESRPGLLQALTRVPPEAGATVSVIAEVGAKIECSVHDASGMAALEGSLNISSLSGFVNLASLSEPIIAERKVSFKAVLTPGVSTMVIDIPSPSNPTITLADFQVHATVTKLP